MVEKYSQNQEQALEFCQNQIFFLRELLRQKIQDSKKIIDKTT